MSGKEKRTLERPTTAENLIDKFDNGEDVSDYFDFERAEFHASQTRRVNVDFPAWVVEALDAEARRLGISRQALVKIWIAEELDRRAKDATQR